MCNLPFNIPDEETIVRGVMCPAHVKKGQTSLRPSAFRSKAETDDVSSFRHDHLGVDFCKAKSQGIAAGGKNDYAGLVAIKAVEIRGAGSDVEDTREEFCGHASIRHGLISPRDEPAESVNFQKITERCRELVKRARYFPDPAPELANWTGPQI